MVLQALFVQRLLISTKICVFIRHDGEFLIILRVWITTTESASFAVSRPTR